MQSNNYTPAAASTQLVFTLSVPFVVDLHPYLSLSLLPIKWLSSSFLIIRLNKSSMYHFGTSVLPNFVNIRLHFQAATLVYTFFASKVSDYTVFMLLNIMLTQIGYRQKKTSSEWLL